MQFTYEWDSALVRESVASGKPPELPACDTQVRDDDGHLLGVLFGMHYKPNSVYYVFSMGQTRMHAAAELRKDLETMTPKEREIALRIWDEVQNGD